MSIETPSIPLASRELPSTLRQLNPEHLAQLLNIISSINHGLELEQVLEILYDSAQDIVPCDRLGLALVDPQKMTVRSRWVRSNRPVSLGIGFSADLNGSSLKAILETGTVRIINDLERYLQEHPQSHQTRLIVQEGMRSSLTCPLYSRNGPLGFLFFTSAAPNAYGDVELLFYQHIATQVSIVIERAQLYSSLAEYTSAIEKQNRAIHHNLELAKQLQRTFIPERPPEVPGLDMALLYEPLEQVGGDLVELRPMPGGKLLILVADAMGHGVPAALAMAVVKATFHAVIDKAPPDPSTILQQLNEALPPLLQSQFAAGLAMLVDPVANTISTARAGLPPPILIDGRTGEAREMEAGGLPLSVRSAEAYENSFSAFEQNDVIILATDGMTEATNPEGEQYGSAGVIQAATACHGLSAGECLEAMIRDQIAFRDGRPPADDMTALLVRHT